MKKKLIDLCWAALCLGIIVFIVMSIAYRYINEPMPEYEPQKEQAVVEELYIEPVETSEPTEKAPELVSIGTYTITHYCSCERCCGKSDGVTASGVVATENHTIAAGSEIPFGTELIINGITYVVEDRGGAIGSRKIDIYCSSHEEALQKGIYETEVFKKGE